VAHDQLTYDDLLRIVELVKSSDRFSEFRLKVGDIEVELRRGSNAPPLPLTPAAPPPREGRPSSPESSPAKPQPAARPVPTWPDDAIVARHGYGWEAGVALALAAVIGVILLARRRSARSGTG